MADEDEISRLKATVEGLQDTILNQARMISALKGKESAQGITMGALRKEKDRSKYWETLALTRGQALERIAPLLTKLTADLQQAAKFCDQEKIKAENVSAPRPGEF